LKPNRGGPGCEAGLEGATAVQGRPESGILVERIAAGGDGVAREESGRVVFVPRTAPGDVVEVELTRQKPSWARGRVTRLVSAGGGRRDAPCPYYEECGGCQLQHLELEAQRSAKRDLVQQALSRIGGVDVAVPDLVPSSAEFGYRNRVTFSGRELNGRSSLGYHGLDDPGSVVDVRKCLLAEPAIGAVWTAVREAWDVAGWPASPVAETRWTLRSAAGGAVDVLIRGGESPDPGKLAELMQRLNLSGWHHAPTGGRPICLAGRETLADCWQGIDFELPADVFLQVNRSVSVEMDRWLEERVGSLSGRRVLDLYSGVGARAIRWASAGADVAAVEVSSPAVRACRQAAAAMKVRLKAVSGLAETHVDRLLPADTVVVNPPRAGLSRSVTERLSSASAERLAYVSCDPATLARDVGRLGPGWRVVEVQPFDAFPQTSHVETIAWLERR